MSTAVFVEESLDHDLFLRRHYTEREFGHGQILDNLFRRTVVESNDINQPANTGTAGALSRITIETLKPFRNLSSQSRDRLR
jgi:hypothetical protein